jgi:prolyl-tRNA editing enzyme YbaK/EbsC (Cys-tRNA(Pro) deacylase)
VVLATTRLDVNGTVRKRLGVRKASFASAEETRVLTGMSIGGVTPLALPEDLPIWVDQRVMTRPEVVLGGGSRWLKIGVAPHLFARMRRVEVVPDLATEG